MRKNKVRVFTQAEKEEWQANNRKLLDDLRIEDQRRIKMKEQNQQALQLLLVHISRP